LGLAAQPGRSVRVADTLGWQHLDRHHPVEFRVVRPIDGPHAALANLLQETVALRPERFRPEGCRMIGAGLRRSGSTGWPRAAPSAAGLGLASEPEPARALHAACPTSGSADIALPSPAETAETAGRLPDGAGKYRRSLVRASQGDEKVGFRCCTTAHVSRLGED